MALSVKERSYLYEDLFELYPGVVIPPFSPNNQSARIRTIFDHFVQIPSERLFKTAVRCYNLIYKEGATAIYYAARQILDRMAQVQEENPNRPVHALFSGRDATGLWLMTRALQIAKRELRLAPYRLHLLYFSRPIVTETDQKYLRQYIENVTCTKVADTIYFFIDVGWTGSRFAKLQSTLNGHIRCYFLLFSRFFLRERDLPNLEHGGLIDGLEDPLPELPSLSREEYGEKSDSLFQKLQESPAVNFIEDIFAGPFQEMQLLNHRLVPYALDKNLRHPRLTDSVPRFFALLALVDRVEEMRQKNQYISPSRQEARECMSFIFQNCEGIF